MPKPVKEQNPGREPVDSPVAWFTVLEHARLVNDFELAAKAQRELRRLGVLVKFQKLVDGRQAIAT